MNVAVLALGNDFANCVHGKGRVGLNYYVIPLVIVNVADWI
jgi:hypothetical protein